MKKKSYFQEFLGSSPRIKLIEFFVECTDFDHTLTSSCEFAKINRITGAELIKEFISKGILIETRKMGKSQLYTLNKNSLEAKLYLDCYKSIIDYAFNKTKQSPVKDH